jgi:hypothetical protein
VSYALDTPASNEIREIIHLLHAKNTNAAEMNYARRFTTKM